MIGGVAKGQWVRIAPIATHQPEMARCVCFCAHHRNPTPIRRANGRCFEGVVGEGQAPLLASIRQHAIDLTVAIAIAGKDYLRRALILDDGDGVAFAAGDINLVPRRVECNAFFCPGRHGDAGHQAPVICAVDLDLVSAHDKEMPAVWVDGQDIRFLDRGNGGNHGAGRCVEHRHGVNVAAIGDEQIATDGVESQAVGLIDPCKAPHGKPIVQTGNLVGAVG